MWPKRPLRRARSWCTSPPSLCSTAAKKSRTAETDTPRPINYYGDTKLAGEKEVFAALPDALIVRTSWMYGHGGLHFPGKLKSWVERGGPLRIVDDQIGSPTYSEDLATAIKALVERDAAGLYHLGGAGCASRIAYTQEILDLMGLAGADSARRHQGIPSARRQARQQLPGLWQGFIHRRRAACVA